VRALSGGERNRLLLARLFTRPANVLVLDEPTNDLDIETLELLEAQVLEFPGTILLVSHDRTFLDHVATSTLVFEGAGRVQEYVGGYEDWVRQRRAGPQEAAPGTGPGREAPRAAPAVATDAAGALGAATTAKKRLGFNEQRELAALPGRIEALEAEQLALAARVSSPDFYKEPAPAIDAALARLAAVEAELSDAYARWDELDSRTR
jgi:ATP-binding cassette subfamily F protein uup